MANSGSSHLLYKTSGSSKQDAFSSPSDLATTNNSGDRCIFFKFGPPFILSEYSDEVFFVYYMFGVGSLLSDSGYSGGIKHSSLVPFFTLNVPGFTTISSG